jgi:hypothetical protein
MDVVYGRPADGADASTSEPATRTVSQKAPGG